MFVLQLALIGLCIAALPLSYVWVKADDGKFRKLVWLTTFLTLDLVMFGGFTRLTDSGLGCPDWPGCYGTSSPFIAHAAIAAGSVRITGERGADVTAIFASSAAGLKIMAGIDAR